MSSWRMKSGRMLNELTNKWTFSNMKLLSSSWAIFCLFGVREIQKYHTSKAWMKFLLRLCLCTLRKLMLIVWSRTVGRNFLKSKSISILVWRKFIFCFIRLSMPKQIFTVCLKRWWISSRKCIKLKQIHPWKASLIQTPKIIPLYYKELSISQITS